MVIEQFDVDTSYLRDHVAQMRRSLQDILNAYQTMDDAVKSAEAMWTGPSKDAFHASFTKDCSEFSDICHVIGEILDSMENAAKEYDSSNSRVKGVIDAIRM